MENTRMSFEQLEGKILKSNAKSEYKQASIVILRNIFETEETNKTQDAIGNSEFEKFMQESIEENNKIHDIISNVNAIGNHADMIDYVNWFRHEFNPYETLNGTDKKWGKDGKEYTNQEMLNVYLQQKGRNAIGNAPL